MTATASRSGPSGISYGNMTEQSDNLSDLKKLKEVSEKLQLATRRPSVVQWKQIIEYRKSHGQYVTSRQPPYLDNIATQQLTESSEEARFGRYITPQIERRVLDLVLLEENADTPTKNSPVTEVNSAQASVPTPTRRCRRIAAVTPPQLVINEAPNENCENTPPTNPTLLMPSSDDVATVADHGSTSSNKSDVQSSEKDMASRYRRITQAFEKIRQDLIIMRIEDNKLARKLLDVRSELTILRAQTSCDEHADMLDDVTYELQEEEELTRLIKACDLSDSRPGLLLSQCSPLRHIGLSRMNLNRRRFSIR